MRAVLKILLVLVVVVVVVAGGGVWLFGRTPPAKLSVADVSGADPKLSDPVKGLFPTMNIAPAIGWKAGETPTPAAGLKVAAFAAGLAHPRWLYVLPNGDVLVAETDAPPKPDDGKGIRGFVQGLVMKRAGSGTQGSANRISLLRDADGDGVAETKTTFLTGLNSPFGMALVGDQLYVAETDKLTRFPYQAGETAIAAKGVKVVDLPGGTINHHWTKNVIASPDGKLLYVTVGSNSNVGENGMAAEDGRAAIWEVDPKTGSHRIYAYGIRNPNGMAWQPGTNRLWTVANERDELGSDIVPDYLTSVQFGGFYGWPWFYWGGVPDPRAGDPPQNLADSVIKPDYALGPHTASLGLTWSTGEALAPRFASGVFVGQHGSWNRKPKSGYKVVFVPFVGGRPTGKPVDVLTGFLDAKEDARGRPVGVTIDAKGALLVADDVGGKVWRVSGAATPAPAKLASR